MDKSRRCRHTTVDYLSICCGSPESSTIEYLCSGCHEYAYFDTICIACGSVLDEGA